MTSTFSRTNAPAMHRGFGVLFAAASRIRPVLLVS
jgi:hypothetical protein